MKINHLEKIGNTLIQLFLPMLGIILNQDTFYYKNYLHFLRVFKFKSHIHNHQIYAKIIFHTNRTIHLKTTKWKVMKINRLPKLGTIQSSIKDFECKNPKSKISTTFYGN